MRAHSADEVETWREQSIAPTLNPFDHNGETRSTVLLTSSTADSPVRTSAWPASGPVYPASAARSGLSSNASCPNCGHDGRSLRMFPDCFRPTQDGTLPEFSWAWASSGTGGRTEFWTRAGSECPSVVAVSSLSAVLETRPVPRRYWLSARAAAGILRRAERRGKTLPERLMTALTSLATSMPQSQTA